uniref:Uncharacterized protein n=1 Tax=Salix viminalis TaxID=40686 RepID=A0A6N2MHT7_SALVM
MRHFPSCGQARVIGTSVTLRKALMMTVYKGLVIGLRKQTTTKALLIKCTSPECVTAAFSLLSSVSDMTTLFLQRQLEHIYQLDPS